MPFIRRTSATVAPTATPGAGVPKPVEVLMKSGRTFSAISHRARFSSSFR